MVDYLLQVGGAERWGAILTDSVDDLHVPALCDVEFLSALRRLARDGTVSLGRAVEALEDYTQLPIERHGHRALLERVFALRDNLSAFDATYVALAERIRATLLTGDRHLAMAVHEHARTVTVISRP